ncbi:hypothetical protein EDB92DRAFT_1272644 [Lactarius akahatsu]|uniref:Uncharacterized protein n=1 Tax=Lactarius akahatsu TaxID=416441 RepID=A0AAD4QB94_9AGAM|nr:hypothetical protein EDB92DRAFT_1272644 [Lactarius akahatsu]
MFAAAFTVTADWHFARDGTWGPAARRMHVGRCATQPARVALQASRRKPGSLLVTGLVFLATLSGAFVARLDAGLIDNEFPLRDGRLSPPLDKLLLPSYAHASDGGKGT